MVAYHPTTILRDTIGEADALFAALARVEGQLFFCYPNADAGSRMLIARAKEFLDRRGNGRVFVNLDPVAYWSLLRDAKFLLGNSSSGIMEAASFGIPAVTQRSAHRSPAWRTRTAMATHPNESRPCWRQCFSARSY